MKQRIFMYLFVFSLLLALFLYVNAKRMIEVESKKSTTLSNELVKYKDSVATLQNEVMYLSHFNLERNEDAISYFEDKGYNIDELIPLIKDELYKLNEAKGEHPMIPYASSEGRRMMINTVKLLNHKWIVADFSDGEFWGELFLTYEITDANELKFNLKESFLYPLN
jgi:hypothetical protein